MAWKHASRIAADIKAKVESLWFDIDLNQKIYLQETYIRMGHSYSYLERDTDVDKIVNSYECELSFKIRNLKNYSMG